MVKWLACCALLLGLLGHGAGINPAHAASSAHDFAFTSIEGEPLPLSRYRGRPILLVNTASRCGFTYQYDNLQTVWQRYRDRGLVVLAVPSDDFRQELADEAAVKEFCAVNFALDFPMTTINRVRGAEAHPLYRFARTALGARAQPGWNFYKILFDAEGQPIAVWPSHVAPTAPPITQAIEAQLTE